MRIEIRSGGVLAGGCCLAFLAAAVNVTFLMELGTSVSHLTGDLSRFAEDLARSDAPHGVPIARLAAALLGFVGGASLSGVFIHHRALELSRPYGRSIVAIGLLLVASWTLIESSAVLATALAAMACGFQNALATHDRGVILRTTHVTGLLTDLGVTAGMALRRRRVAAWAWVAPLGLTVAYFLGAIGGALGTLALGRDVLVIVGATYVVGGLGWSVLKRQLARRTM